LTLLDRFLPRFDFAERHQRTVAAAPERVWEAIHAVTLREMLLTRALFAVRSVPDRLAGRRGLPTDRDRPILEQMLEVGFVSLGEDPARELVVGVVGRTSKGAGEIERIQDGSGFAAPGPPGLVKAAMNFLLIPIPGGTELQTETRVLATDERSRRRFRFYWLAIRAGSGAIRREWLRAIARRAEARQERDR
jgi:hypothetical protein